jgi:hypothetical protein
MQKINPLNYFHYVVVIHPAQYPKVREELRRKGVYQRSTLYP